MGNLAPIAMPSEAMLMNATPDQQLELAANTLKFNLRAIAAQVDAVRVLLQEDAARPEGEKQISSNTLLLTALAVDGWGTPWGQIGNDLQVIQPLLPEVPPAGGGGEEEEEGA